MSHASFVALGSPESSVTSAFRSVIQSRAVAASSRAGVSGFTPDPDGAFRGTIAIGGAVEVETVLLDDLARTVDLIKNDVEGHERDVLDGAMQKLARHRPHVLVECSHSGAPCLGRVLRELDYSCTPLDEANYLLVPNG